MVLGAWYPHGLCRLSLGPRDMLQGIVDAVDWGGIRGSWIAAGGAEWRRLRDLCAAQLDGAALLRFVPFRLLRPFFAAETRGLSDHRVNEAVATLADEHFQDRKPLYCFTDDRAGIILLHDWLEYLGRNAAILRGWARFKLAQYLQARNPAVAGIVDKLEPPLARSSLAAQSSWWREAIPLLGARARCVYSGLALEAADFSLDHYLPWSFVAHDRLWNLVPATRAINSAMSDRLPAQRYLDGMVGLQHAGIVAMREAWGETRWLKAIEQWIVDLRMDKGSMLDEGKLRAAYGATVAPLAGMAERQGFEGGWEFGP